MAPDCCVPSEWKLVHVTHLAPSILKRVFGFWKVCPPLLFTVLSRNYHYPIQHCAHRVLFPRVKAVEAATPFYSLLS